MSVYMHSYYTHIYFLCYDKEVLIVSLVVAKPADMLLGVCEGIPRDEQKEDDLP